MSKKIAIFLPPDSLGMSALLIKNLLWIAAQYAHAESPENQASQILCVSLDGNPVDEFSGGHLAADCSLEDLGEVDAVFLSAFWSNPQQALQQCAAAVCCTRSRSTVLE